MKFGFVGVKFSYVGVKFLMVASFMGVKFLMVASFHRSQVMSESSLFCIDLRLTLFRNTLQLYYSAIILQ